MNHGTMGMECELVVGPYGAGVEEDNRFHSSLIPEAGAPRPCACGKQPTRRRRRRRGWCSSRTAEAGAGPRRWWWRRRPSGRAPGDPTRPPQVAADAVRPTARGLLRRRSGARGGAPAAAPTTPPARRPPSKPAPRLACYCSPLSLVLVGGAAAFARIRRRTRRLETGDFGRPG